MSVRPIFVFLLILSIQLFGCSDHASQPLRNTTEQFWDAIARGDYTRAHRFLTKSLAQHTSVEGLRAFIDHVGLSKPGARTWQDAQVDGEQAKLAGSIAINGEQLEVPVRVNYLKEGMYWKIAGLERGVQVNSPQGLVTLFAPTKRDSAQLAKQTTMAFASAVSNNNLRGFWNTTADLFKQQYSADQFTSAFMGFIRDKANLSPAAKLDPEFKQAPTIGPNGELVLEGTFPTAPSRVTFQYRYVLQDGSWKTSGLTINLAPQE